MKNKIMRKLSKFKKTKVKTKKKKLSPLKNKKQRNKSVVLFNFIVKYSNYVVKSFNSIVKSIESLFADVFPKLFPSKNLFNSILTGLIVAGLFSTTLYIFATYGVDEPYPLGNTLTPTCAPGDDNCTVVTPAYFSFGANNFSGTGSFTTTGTITGHSAAAAIFVAASNSTADAKARANYIADGTDDQVEIQAAIDSIPLGGKIYLLAGTYSISDEIHINHSIYISGEGMDYYSTQHGTQLKLADNANCNMFELDPTAGGDPYNLPQFEHMQLDGNKANNTTSSAFYQNPGSGIDIKFYSIWFDSWKGPPIVLKQYWDHTIDMCVFEHNDDYALSLEPVSESIYPVDVWMTNNFIKNTAGGLKTSGTVAL